MSFTGYETHSINLLDAADLTSNYRDSNPGAVQGFYYSKQAITAIMNQTDCVGIRIYYGEDNTGAPKLVISGVKANEDDITSGLLAEYGSPCPPNCGASNSLNS
jgi:hypothetical protein